MSFISPEFVIFFSVVMPLFFWMRHRFRWALLLVLSYLFYAYGTVQYLPLIIISTLVDYVAARMMPLRPAPAWRTAWLLASISVNLGILFTFKYFNFFGEVMGSAFGYTPVMFDVVLPVGISFYTFQSMSYTIDVYRGRIQPEKHVGIVAAYVAFFPQLVAGPIERATNLMPQFNERKLFDEERTVSGLQLILWGFFKKVVIADRLAIYVNTVYNDVHNYSGVSLWLATFFFAFQIYCDFSAYSDIAIGTARILGFNLMENFRQPYFARSVGEFWGRWHISLSTWFRDYVYIPLGGNRVPVGRHLLNIMIVFLLSGLWHGAGWTFIIWGTLHGLAVVGQNGMRYLGWELFPRSAGWMVAGLKILLTFGFVCFSWIFFRANSLEDAQYIVGHLLVFDPTADVTAMFAEGLLGAQTEFMLSMGLIAGLLVMDALATRTPLPEVARRLPLAVRWPVYYALGTAVVFSGLYGTGAQQFIYFQF
jgi:alginate O-acetyltransferase complex protein AlgI